MQTGADLLTDKQKARLAALFAVDAHAEGEVTWSMYQRTVVAYRHPDRKKGATMMAALITTLSEAFPSPCGVLPLNESIENQKRGLARRRSDGLARMSLQELHGWCPTSRQAVLPSALLGDGVDPSQLTVDDAWKPALNASAITFGDQFPAAETY